jgi:NAD(P)-dependent dehydrogenase (short-subunit alcohol dehydrogenase family)
MRTILITGANKGIGFETAKQLAQQNNFVYIGSRDLAAGQQAADQIKAAGISNVAAIQLDVTDPASISKAKAELERQIGSEGALDVLINNAGISGPEQQKFSEISIEGIREIYATNLFGAIHTTQIMLPLLRRSKAGSIINVSSETGSLAMNTAPDRRPNWGLFSTYGASKTAMNGFTVMLANELSDQNITVNSVTPGYTATDLNQFKGLKTPAEGAKPIVELAMSSDRTVTGKFFKDSGEVPW